jgi:hypothetical protein
MRATPIVTIPLTKEQQVEVLGATGVLVQTLEVDAEAPDDSGAAMARLPLPDWLTKREPRSGHAAIRELSLTLGERSPVRKP